MLELVDDARAEGLDVTFDSYPSEWAATRLLIQLPQWVQAAARDRSRNVSPTGPRAIGSVPSSRRAARRSPARRAGRRPARCLPSAREPALGGPDAGGGDDETGHDALDVICDLLLAEDLGPSQVTSGPRRRRLPLFLSHPVGMVGTDSTFLGEKPSPRTYGSFPRILGQFVRDEALLSLEEAIRQMTSAPAARLGLRDRGVIRDGAVADLVVFDPATVRSTATYDEPRSLPDRHRDVIVAGTLVVDAARTPGDAGPGLRTAATETGSVRRCEGDLAIDGEPCGRGGRSRGPRASRSFHRAPTNIRSCARRSTSARLDSAARSPPSRSSRRSATAPDSSQRSHALRTRST